MVKTITLTSDCPCLHSSIYELESGYIPLAQFLDFITNQEMEADFSTRDSSQHCHYEGSVIEMGSIIDSRSLFSAHGHSMALPGRAPEK